MKDKVKSSQKKSTGSRTVQSTTRSGSGSGARRSGAAVQAGKAEQQTMTAPVTDRKRVEEALKESEQKYKLLIEATNTGYVIIDETGRVLDANQEYVRMTGRSRLEDLLGRPVTDWTAPYDLERSAAEVRKCLVRGSVRNLVIDYIDHQEKTTPIEMNATMLPGTSGARIITICRDITERKWSEDALRISEERFRKVFLTSPDSININRLEDGMYISINHGFTTTTGYTASDVIGRTSLELNIWADPADRQKLVEGLRMNGEVKNLETRFRLKDGRIIDGLMSTAIVEIDHIPHIISVTRDISERKKTELALKQSDTKYRRLYNETPVLLHSINRNGIVVDVNDYWLKTMGYERDEVLGRKVTDFYTDASRKYAEDVIQPAFFRDGVVKDISYQFVKKNGTIADVLLSANSERDDSGKVVRSLAVIEDVTERKRIEEDLLRSEERYRDLFENAIDPIVIVDEKQNYLDVNKRAVELFGYSRQEILSMNVRDMLPPDQLPRSENAFNELVSQGAYQQFIGKMRKKDGSFVDIEVSSSAIVDSGRVIGSRDIIRDITERKRAEGERQKSERMLQTIIEAEPECVKLLDENANLIMMNRAGLDMIQVDSLDQVKGRCICPMIASEDCEAFLEMTRRVFQGGSGSLQFQMVGMQGRQLLLETHAVPLRNEKDEIIALLGVTRDITERKRAEEALRENQARLDLALQSAHMGVWRWEIKEDRRYFDELTCQVLGIEARLFTGTMEEFYRAVHPEDCDKLRAALNRTLEQDVPYEPSYRVVWPDGSVHYITSRGRLFRDDKGQPARINGILWDITEQHLLEQELIETEKLESIGILAGGIAHDFNNLLQGVFGFISMARLTFDQKDKSLAMLAQAEKALHQSVNLTSQLLTFSKGGKPVKKVFALQPLIESSVAFALSGSRVTSEIAADKDLRAVEADEGQIGQVIQNIVLNADQAMPLGGMIRISVRNMSASEITPPADLQGDFVEIAIRDQGTGIPAEYLSRIFDPYFTTKEKGSGLGLASSYSIIKNHGGLVRVQSWISKGTTFSIYLPASGSAAEGPKGRAITATAWKGRILVMDDEEMIRAVAGELLTTIGHEVAFAEKGETAMETYRAAKDAGRPFDVVILDLTIRGGMGGMETLRKLMEIDPDVKAIVSSGYSDDAALSNYRAQGFRAFLKKPYDIVELQNTLNALLA